MGEVLSILLFAFGGGIAVNILRLAELSNIPKPQRPETFTNPYYLIQFIFFPLIGAGLAYAYQTSGTNLTPLVAINIGASAPLIIKSLASAAPPIGGRRTD